MKAGIFQKKLNANGIQRQVRVLITAGMSEAARLRQLTWSVLEMSAVKWILRDASATTVTAMNYGIVVASLSVQVSLVNLPSA